MSLFALPPPLQALDSPMKVDQLECFPDCSPTVPGQEPLQWHEVAFVQTARQLRWPIDSSDHVSNFNGPSADAVLVPHFQCRGTRGNSSRHRSTASSSTRDSSSCSSSGSSGPLSNTSKRAEAAVQQPRASSVKPVAGNIQQASLVAAYFPRSASTAELISAFSRYGNVVSANIIRDAAGVSKCFGFVNFETALAASMALADCERGRVIIVDTHGKKWHLKANLSQLPGPRRSRRRCPTSSAALASRSGRCGSAAKAAEAANFERCLARA